MTISCIVWSIAAGQHRRSCALAVPHGATSFRCGCARNVRDPPIVGNMAASDTRTLGKAPSGKERILDAAYDLFSRSGVRAIGVDTITAEADVAKMTLYRNFASKNDLALAFLAMREQR